MSADGAVYEVELSRCLHVFVTYQGQVVVWSSSWFRHHPDTGLLKKPTPFMRIKENV